MRRVFVTGICMSLFHITVLAQEDPSAGGFKSTLSAGLTLTDGNSETLQVNAALLTEGEKDGFGSVLAGMEGNYGESTVASNKATTVENARAFVNVKKTISPRTFGSANAELMYDDIAQIDYRATLGPGLGVYLVKNDRMTLSTEAGPSYIWGKVAGVRDDYLTVRVAERFECAIGKTARIWQSVEYLPRADDFGDYLLHSELGAEAAMNERVNLRIVLQDKYDSTPGDDLEQNDLTLIAGIGVTL